MILKLAFLSQVLESVEIAKENTTYRIFQVQKGIIYIHGYNQLSPD